MQLTTRTNLAMRTLMVCALNPEEMITKSLVAGLCNASENHLGQVVRLLARNGFVDSTRGRHGGIQLSRTAREINVGAVFRVFEFDLPFAECFAGGNNTCPLISCCWLRPALKRAVEEFYCSLDKLTLADLVDGNSQLEQLLCVPTMRMECPANKERARAH